MKLFTKVNRYFGISIIIAFVFSSIFIFYGIRYLFEVESKEKLEIDEYRLIQLIKQNAQIESLAPFFSIKIVDASKEIAPKISLIELYGPIEDEDEEYIQLSSVRKINGIYYRLKVRHATVESDELMLVVMRSFLGVMLLSFIILFFVNKSLSRKLWIPFYTTLVNLQTFSIEKEQPIRVKATNIDEFDALNESLEQFSTKLIQDYKSLQEFTENASHEIQTPLSVVLLNLEEALQKDLDEETSSKIYTSYQAALRLSRLNEKLLLLTKLDNKQFTQLEKVDLTTVIQKLLIEYAPLFEAKTIAISTEYKCPFNIQLDKGLATILISNLLSNALKYCDEKSEVEIHIVENKISISNSTAASPDISKLFERFHKLNANSDSLGLGLSIVKKIADISGLMIELKLKNGKFVVQLSTK